MVNIVPTANAGLDVTIPAQTPFFLTATSVDPDANGGLSYNFEQGDSGVVLVAIPRPDREFAGDELLRDRPRQLGGRRWRQHRRHCCDRARHGDAIRMSTDGDLTFPTELLADTPNDGSAELSLTKSSSAVRLMVHSGDFANGSGFFDISDANFTVGKGTAAGFTSANPARLLETRVGHGLKTIDGLSEGDVRPTLHPPNCQRPALSVFTRSEPPMSSLT